MTNHPLTPSLDATEKVGSEGATSPRITLEYIKSQIVSVWYIDGGTIAGAANHIDWEHAAVGPHVRSAAPNLHLLTVCMIVLKNGFILLGKSAPLSPDNYNAEKGRIFAFEDALRQTWPLFAFARLQNHVEIVPDQA